MDIMGARTGTAIQAIAFTTEASKAYMGSFRRDGISVKSLVNRRNATFGETKEEPKRNVDSSGSHRVSTSRG